MSVFSSAFAQVGTQTGRQPRSHSQIFRTEFSSDSSARRPAPPAEFAISPRYISTFARDVGYVFLSPIRWRHADWERFSLFAITMTGTVTILDKPVRNLAQRNRNRTTNDIADRFNHFGFNYPPWILGGFYLTGLVLHDNTAQAVGLDGLAATIIASNVITPALKKVVGRRRPYLNQGRLSFDPFSGQDSWPSGHATLAFVTASVIAEHYHQLWVKLVAYGLATMVAYARVNYDVHWTSDVFAGAVVGISVGHAVVHYNLRLRRNR